MCNLRKPKGNTKLRWHNWHWMTIPIMPFSLSQLAWYYPWVSADCTFGIVSALYTMPSVQSRWYYPWVSADCTFAIIYNAKCAICGNPRVIPVAQLALDRKCQLCILYLVLPLGFRRLHIRHYLQRRMCNLRKPKGNTSLIG